MGRISVLIFSLFLSVGCQVFNFDDPKPPNSFQDAGNIDTGSATGSMDVDTDSDSDLDVDTDTDSGTASDVDTDTNGASDAGTENDAGLDTETESYKDSDTVSSAPTEPIDTSTPTVSGPDSATVTEVDSELTTDTCSTPQTCIELGWDCGSGVDGCGNDLSCPDCAEGSWCNAHTCESCTTTEHCGPNCDLCTGDTPDCGSNGCVCNNTSCPEGYRCHEGSCTPCITDDACGTGCNACPSETPLCTGADPTTATCECTDIPDSCGDFSRCVTGECESCGSTNDACGADCVPCSVALPFCDTNRDDGTCVECIQDADCRGGDAPPHNSPLGICSPEGTCTCWVNPEAATPERWECSDSIPCPDGFQCARDYDVDVNSHAVCLRECPVEQTAIGGLACQDRASDGPYDYVWVPMTSCFAFDKFGDTCSGLNDDCSVDGDGPIGDGVCYNLTCTYSCWDDDAVSQPDWCPEVSSGCGKVLPNIYCTN